MDPRSDFIVVSVCFFLMFCALMTDLRTGRIPNALTGPTMLAGLCFHMLRSGWAGAIFSFQGLLAGMGLLILLFIMGGMGGGDVKLLGAAGAWLGPGHICVTGLSGMLIGGLLSMGIIIRQTGWRHVDRIPFQLYHSLTHKRLSTHESPVTYPYALSLAMGYLVHRGFFLFT